MPTRKSEVQYGALPYRINEDGVLDILLVTSRGTKRWIIPKGWPMPPLPPHKAAAREALEEAGVVGRVKRKAIGTYEYDKFAEDGSFMRLSVEVFPLNVERLKENWPEALQRRRQWFAQGEAAELVEEAALKAILRDYRPPSARSREEAPDREDDRLDRQEDDARNDDDRKQRKNKA